MPTASLVLPVASPSVPDDAFLDDARLFTPWTDPESGVRSYLLSRRAAPFQQSFYFVNPSLSDDGRHYWFYAAFPPGGNANQGRSLAVADLREGRVHHYPETVFTDASPLVDPRTGEAYWCCGQEVWRRRPEPEAEPVLVGRFPDEIARNRRPWRLATHLTLSADRREVNIDAEIGCEWHVGSMDLATGEYRPWQVFDRCYNHGQFSPADPDLQLIAQDYAVNPVTAEISAFQNRMWLIRRGEAARPVYPEPVPIEPVFLDERGGHYAVGTSRTVVDARGRHGHEWWGRDGRHVWYVHYGTGVERVDPARGVPEVVWPGALSHAHSDAAETCLVADHFPAGRHETRSVFFRNLATQKTVAIASRLPQIPRALQFYHVHPHPQFCLGDRLVCYTTLVRGAVDVAFARVADLLDRTA